MEGGVISSNVILGTQSDSTMDLDFMDELLLAGCWIETTDGSDFFNQSPYGYSSSPLFDSSDLLPNSEVHTADDSSDKQLLFEPQKENRFESSEVNKRLWIGPPSFPGPSSSVRERLIQALRCFRDSTIAGDVLIQLWVPVNRNGRRVLTTSDQPFSLDPNCSRLSSYRNVSVHYQFAAEKDTNESNGLPGRVFLSKVPEWTPDVQFFRSDEYPRVDYAQQYDVRGTLALPVFEQGSQTCLGVIEVVMTTQKVNYRPELESVCKALEAVDLRCSEVSSTENVKESEESYQAALPEILEIVKTACGAHRLPLAQTWAPCIQHGKGGPRHSHENYDSCVSTVDSACYVAEPKIHGFHEACSEHHLLKGQGVAGRAFTTNQPCFSTDITAFGQTEYPLSHHARLFGLRAAVAIRLRSIYTCKADFVLEFFLPVECTDLEDQKKLLGSLSVIIQKVCRSLRVVTDKELEEEAMPNMEDSLSSEKQSEVLSGKTSDFGYCAKDFSPKGSVRFGGDKKRKKISKGKNLNLGEGEFLSGVETRERRRIKSDKSITLQVLQQYFAGSLKDAARSIGVCPTTLKRICRQHGIKRWPSRKIRKVSHSLEKIQLVINSVQGASGAFQINSFYPQFPVSAQKPKEHQKPTGEILSPRDTASAYSCSQSSSSSHSCSSGTHQHSFALAGDDRTVGENGVDGIVLKRAKSDADLRTSSNEGSTLLPRSQTHDFESSAPPLPESSADAWRVKVTYVQEKIRFRMLKSWGLADLLQETGRRFSIDDMSRFQLKYLDDDTEWVLLTCDADLEECFDICRISQSRTIKLSLHQVSNHRIR